MFQQEFWFSRYREGSVEWKANLSGYGYYVDDLISAQPMMTVPGQLKVNWVYEASQDMANLHGLKTHLPHDLALSQLITKNDLNFKGHTALGEILVVCETQARALYLFKFYVDSLDHKLVVSKRLSPSLRVETPTAHVTFVSQEMHAKGMHVDTIIYPDDVDLIPYLPCLLY